MEGNARRLSATLGEWEKANLKLGIELCRMDPGLEREREESSRLKAVGEILREFSFSGGHGMGMAENSSKVMASDAGKVMARPDRERQEDDAEGEKKVALEKELRAQRSDKEQCVA